MTPEQRERAALAMRKSWFGRESLDEFPADAPPTKEIWDIVTWLNLVDQVIAVIEQDAPEAKTPASGGLEARVRALLEWLTTDDQEGDMADEPRAMMLETIVRLKAILTPETEEQRARRKLGEWLAVSFERNRSVFDRETEYAIQSERLGVLLSDEDGRHFIGEGHTREAAILAALAEARKAGT